MEFVPPATINEVAIALHRFVVEMKSANPEYLVQKYRFLPWSDRSLVYISKIAAFLATSDSRIDLLNNSARLVRCFFVPGFIYTRQFAKFSLSLNLIINETPTHLFGTVPVAALLLDAENLRLSAQLEEFIARHCLYPLAVKYAFGNWKNLGKWDNELHSRGYALVHVPPGKNNADYQLIEFGITMPNKYPFVKEVVVVSNDSDLISLDNYLAEMGTIVWKVGGDEKQFKMTNCLTGQVHTYGKTNFAFEPGSFLDKQGSVLSSGTTMQLGPLDKTKRNQFPQRLRTGVGLYLR